MKDEKPKKSEEKLESEKANPTGSSITLWGSGDRSGRDVNNSMGLGEAYRYVVLSKE